MLNWFHRPKESQARLKVVEIGLGNVTVELLAHFVVEQGEDSTTVAYDPALSKIALRFNVLQSSDLQMSGSSGYGSEAVNQWAKAKHLRMIRNKNIVYAYCHEPSQEKNEPGDVHLWTAGIGEFVVFVSCWVPRIRKNHPDSHALLSFGEAAVRSLCETKYRKVQYAGGPQWSVQPLLPEHVELMEQSRQSAIDLARALLGKASFTGGESDLRIIQSLLDHPNFDKNQDLAIVGLGIILGGILAHKLDLQWVSITDERDSTPALEHMSANLTLFPRDMIKKRIDRGERVNVIYLFNSLCEETHNQIASNKFHRVSSLNE
jgi:hypothetical protein